MGSRAAKKADPLRALLSSCPVAEPRTADGDPNALTHHLLLPIGAGVNSEVWGGHRLSSTVVAPLSASWLFWPNETPVVFPGIALTNHTGVVSLTTTQLPTEQSSHPLLHFYQH